MKKVIYSLKDNPENLKVVKTARTLEAINEAVQEGKKIIIKKIERHPDIRTKYCVVRNTITGKISEYHDYRFAGDENEEILIDWSYTYPYTSPLPYAAYILPDDIAVGEIVFVEDLIEDFLGKRWNQGDQFRLPKSNAIWNGTSLEILYRPEKYNTLMIG